MNNKRIKNKYRMLATHKTNIDLDSIIIKQDKNFRKISQSKNIEKSLIISND